MQTYDLSRLLSIVESVRERVCPSLDGRFLEAVIHAEDQHPSDNDAIIAIRTALGEALRQRAAD